LNFAQTKKVMPANDSVLVAILNNPKDFALARDQHWYRIPVTSAEKWLKNRWPPHWLAFYQTKSFGDEAFGVYYYSQVLRIRQVYRWQLFPDQPQDEKSQQRYHQLMIGSLQRLPQPILSRRWRRIVFIPTTWKKFTGATEINDLYDESPLEDRLWAELKRKRLNAERQDFVTANSQDYALDFAFYCASGKLDVETDGDSWHSDPKRIAHDNRRDNDLETSGWKLLRFNTYQLNEQMNDYCLPTIAKNINNLGGVDEGRMIPRDVNLSPSDLDQLSLFDDQARQNRA
jgi:very-short-patch-repair endonuclease